jgi:hypothetical protein
VEQVVGVEVRGAPQGELRQLDGRGRDRSGRTGGRPPITQRARSGLALLLAARLGVTVSGDWSNSRLRSMHPSSTINIMLSTSR